MANTKRIRIYVQQYSALKHRWVNEAGAKTHEEAIEKMHRFNEMNYKGWIEKGLTPEKALAKIPQRRVLDNNGWTYTE